MGPTSHLPLSLPLPLRSLRCSAQDLSLDRLLKTMANFEQLPPQVGPIDLYHAWSHKTHTHKPHHIPVLHLEKWIYPNWLLGAYTACSPVLLDYSSSAVTGVGRLSAILHWQKPCKPPKQGSDGQGSNFWQLGSFFFLRQSFYTRFCFRPSRILGQGQLYKASFTALRNLFLSWSELSCQQLRGMFKTRLYLTGFR